MQLQEQSTVSTGIFCFAGQTQLTCLTQILPSKQRTILVIVESNHDYVVSNYFLTIWFDYDLFTLAWSFFF